MSATPIPDPLPVSCTDCHQPMRVEYQCIDGLRDSVTVAAECRCGRVIGSVCGSKIAAHRYGARPITRRDIDAYLGDVGKEAAGMIAFARQRIAEAERLVAAATWANRGRARWTGDNWIWCGACQQRPCSVINCTNHEDAPR